MDRKIFGSIVLGIALLSGAITVTEAAYLPMSLKEISSVADTIVAGRCVEVEQGYHPMYSNIPVTFVTLKVADTIKGGIKERIKGRGGGDITFMQYGHKAILDTTPYYESGETMLLFLYRAGQYGLTSPVGGLQGKLPLIVDTEDGKPGFVNFREGKLSYKEFRNRITNIIEGQTENE